MILGREPVMFMALIQAALAVAMGLGLFSLTVDQVATVMGFAAAVLGFIARSQVTPTG